MISPYGFFTLSYSNNEVINLEEKEKKKYWQSFIQTGQIQDYLKYSRLSTEEETASS